ncbi:MAG TPA: hypothetical protein VKD72_38440 [Gemmataceae bacterium]|nr:hypothetical protein [Gemmataceae bacterium]
MDKFKGVADRHALVPGSGAGWRTGLDLNRRKEFPGLGKPRPALTDSGERVPDRPGARRTASSPGS